MDVPWRDVKTIFVFFDLRLSCKASLIEVLIKAWSNFLSIIIGFFLPASKILILGFSFKENCPDFRNTKVADLYKNLNREGNKVHVHDPWVDKADVYEEYGIEIIDLANENYYDAIVLAVAHSEFKKLTPEILKNYCKQNHIIFDMKHLYDASSVEGRL